MKPIYPILLAAAVATAACSGHSDAESQSRQEVFNDTKPSLAQTVAVKVLQPGALSHDIVSNGRLRSKEVADVFFRNAEIVSEVMVRNGQHVAAGQPLARLDDFKLKAEKQRSAAALEQARLELQDVLIGQGYNPDAPAAIPADVMKLARVRSGMEQAESQFNNAVKDLEQATIKAPHAGVVANLKVERHSMASTSEPACRIINDGAMVVEFPVLESEMGMLAPGDAIELTPIANGKSYTGRVSEINPMIDDKGQVTVKAALDRANGLVDGMNARIRIKRQLGERLVVPKSAVVLRTGKQVVFTARDGKAMWNYVTTGLENLDSYEITEGLNPGDSVIISGNENLAHEAAIIIGD